ncbi:MAG: transcription-repair coupling factor [Capsulimonas sp.]|jgi:transcription-repair coupling factor (superfamily II helicase)|nr:transcription-repair coupling factor [Capsulimonas sp.]
MDLRELPALVDDLPAYHELKKRIEVGGLTQIEGLPVAAKSFILAQLARELGHPIVVVTYNADQAARICADLARYGVEDDALVSLVSSTETLVFAEGAPDLTVLGRRTAALQKLARGEARLVVGPIGAFLQRTVAPEALRDRSVTISVSGSVEIADLEKTLAGFGYDRVEAVENPGQWTRRGGILDIFPGDAVRPFRIDFFGDEVESIRPFDVESQRSVGKAESLTVHAIREAPLTEDAIAEAVTRLKDELPGRMAALRKANEEGKGAEHADRLEERIEADIAQLSSGTYFDQTEYYLPYLEPRELCALDYLPEGALLVLDEPNQAKARLEQIEKEVLEIAGTRAARGEWLTAETPHACNFSSVVSHAAKSPATIIFSLLGQKVDGLRASDPISTQSGAMESFAGRFPSFFEAIDGWLGARFRVAIVTEQSQKIRELLADHKIPASPQDRLQPGGEGGVYVLDGSLLGGFKLAEAALMVATDTDIFGHRAHQKPKKRAFKEGLKLTSYLELREGDYVVHINHGIGYYAGITRLKSKDGAERDYLLLEYAGGDKVYVPTDQIDRVQKYIGSQESTPTVTRLNSGEWTRATKKAQKQVQEMAADLIKLYAARKAATGHSIAPDTPWQMEMEEAFPYQETPDQLAAIEDVKRDLEDDKPMDRLICGDVGYGKTEVAIRAAFKVVNAGRQVAVLCPTTILAQQHLVTFRERLAQYPVKIEMLSRFVSKAEADRTIKALAEGTVDIVVGTHKLLSKDVKFRNLGMLVVDEEQRFGVAHKERIKAIKKNVDVLTLTATPIPRTLHMSLSGIRDMSLIDDPPEGRQPIKTYVKEYDDELIREVILRELDRGGQVYYLHNRIESITHVAEHLRRLVSQATVDIAHGQMHEDDLEDVMVRFANKEFNILVCTTIVESGLDIPNVNTIIVDNADKLGLAQLYQLRGRVGRSKRQGYAYLLYRKDKILSEIAEKRLGALREFSDLGSGYKVAMRDLEIRGAGNLLGAAQSGTVATVGFDLYTQLLSQAINELKGEDMEPEWELPNVALPLDAHIPPRYIPSEAERILIYKKLTAVRRMEDVARIQEELEDRYGDPPRSVWNLLATLRLRLRCLEVGIGNIVAEKRRVAIRFRGTHIPMDTIKKLARLYMQHQFLPDVVFLATPDTPARMLTVVEEMVEVLAKAMPKNGEPGTVDSPKQPPRPVGRTGVRSASA